MEHATIAHPRVADNATAAVGRGIVARKPPVLATASGHGFRVLQTRSAPAQLPLFLRPGPR